MTDRAGDVPANEAAVNGATGAPPTPKGESIGDSSAHNYSNTNPAAKNVEELYDIPVGKYRVFLF